MTLYAHTHPDYPCEPEKWQPLEQHLLAVAEQAAGFAAAFASAEWAWNAGWLHDIGKADSIFQGYLLRSNGLDDVGYDCGRVNHSSAGAACAEDRVAQAGRILAYLIAGHHAGLPDWDSVNTGQAALSFRFVEGRQNQERISAFAEAATEKLKPMQRPAFVTAANFHFWVRMLFSALVDADRLDTESFMNARQASLRGRYPTLVELAPLLFTALDRLEQQADRSDVNVIRAEVRRACEAQAGVSRGLFSLTVPTGGGKTLSAMAFALRHAIAHGHTRVIYVIPYTSIIEQTGRVLAGIFGRENVIEHHSNLSPAKETPRAQLAAENWDAPIIVTTNVQFFESLYAAKPGRCRKLHNIANSVVILDEAQMLPPELLTPCIDVMQDLVTSYGATLVLATATQPALPGMTPAEIIPAGLKLYERLQRTEIRLPPDLNQRTDWPTVAAELRQHEQVLCIVNTRRDCHDLCQLMPPDTLHLSALMCGAHRAAVIRLIRARLRKGLPVRVVSTQLVEAGVDIDFPVVYRALAGLDSIAQAAGRCNREGRRARGTVHVFVPPRSAPRGLLLKGENTTREMCAMGCDPDRPEAYKRYFELFYSRLNDTGSQFRDWLVKDVSHGFHVQFRTAAEHFRLIDDQAQRAVIVRYGPSPKWIARLRRDGPTRHTMRALQRYTVNIARPLAEAMRTDGRLEEPWPEMLAQTDMNLYQRATGLAVFQEQLSAEDLIV